MAFEEIYAPAEDDPTADSMFVGTGKINRNLAKTFEIDPDTGATVTPVKLGQSMDASNQDIDAVMALSAQTVSTADLTATGQTTVGLITGTAATFSSVSVSGGVGAVALSLTNSGFSGTLIPTTLTGPRTYTLPNASGTLALLSTAQTFTVPQVLTGVTDGSSAAAGKLGEYISASVATGAPIALVTGTPKTVISISLTAGDWDVSFDCFFVGFNITGNSWLGSYSLTDNVLDTNMGMYAQSVYSITASVGGVGLAKSPRRLSLTTTTTVYLTVQATFTVGTCNAAGEIRARRVR